MTLKIYTSFFFLFLLYSSLRGQDLHFSQFEKTPLLFNAGQTGNLKGTMRLGAIYRDQWRNFGNFHTTPSFFIDAPVIRGFGKKDWVGAGGVIFQDRAGAGGFGNGAFLLSAAYHMVTGKEAKNVFSLGVQYGTGSLRMRNPFALTFGDGLEAPDGVSVDNQRIPRDPQRYTELAAGLVYTYKILEYDDRFFVGFSAAHISLRGRNNNPMPIDTTMEPGGPSRPVFGGGGGRYGILNSAFYQRPFRFNITAGLDYKIDRTYIIRPGLLYQYYGGHMELVLNAIGGVVINQEEDVAIVGGLGYRFGDSGVAHIGMDYKTLRVGLAYDVNLSSLGAATAFEIGATYIVRIQKRPKVNPVIFCPRF